MRIVVALGGNALLRRGEPPDVAVQRANVRAAAKAIAPLAAAHDLVVTHGNGPQIGLLALQQASLPPERAWPLDVLGAETEGQIGYLLERELRNLLPDRRMATLLTLVEVDADDPAMTDATKPVGPVYSEADWQRIAAASGWQGRRDAGGMRRVVASPAPRAILQADVVADLLSAGVLPICAGGGGVPVTRSADGRLTGIEAVIDKDLTSARLAADLGADLLALLTDVEGIYDRWGDADRTLLRKLSAAEAKALELDAGSMGPKAAAGAWFAETTGKPAVVGALSRAADVVHGAAGTLIEP